MDFQTTGKRKERIPYISNSSRPVVGKGQESPNWRQRNTHEQEWRSEGDQLKGRQESKCEITHRRKPQSHQPGEAQQCDVGIEKKRHYSGTKYKQRKGATRMKCRAEILSVREKSMPDMKKTKSREWWRKINPGCLVPVWTMNSRILVAATVCPWDKMCCKKVMPQICDGTSTP